MTPAARMLHRWPLARRDPVPHLADVRSEHLVVAAVKSSPIGSCGDVVGVSIPAARARPGPSGDG